MNAVSLQGEPNPGRPDGIIGSGGKHQLIGNALLLGHLEKNFRVEGVVGIWRNIRHG